MHVQAEHPSTTVHTAQSDDSANANAVEDQSLGGSDLSQTLAEVTSFLSFPCTLRGVCLHFHTVLVSSVFAKHAHHAVGVCTFMQCCCLLHLQTAALAAAKLLSAGKMLMSCFGAPCYTWSESPAVHSLRQLQTSGRDFLELAPFLSGCTAHHFSADRPRMHKPLAVASRFSPSSVTGLPSLIPCMEKLGRPSWPAVQPTKRKKRGAKL